MAREPNEQKARPRWEVQGENPSHPPKTPSYGAPVENTKTPTRRLGVSEHYVRREHRNRGTAGLGRAMGALAQRHPALLHPLEENRCQVDPRERDALEQLRAGNVGVAAAWYHTAGRIHTQPDRD